MEEQYAGFWIRTLAAFIDTIVVVLMMIPVSLVFGLGDTMELFSTTDIVLNLLIIAAILALWVYTGATPGKMATKIKIVDDKTGNNISVGQSIIRYLGYIIGAIALCLGFFWIGFDKKKQGWHDKMAGTKVIYTE